MATPKRNSPAPSRRCSGSRSRADRPIDRATAPTAWAMPSHTAATPLPSTPKLRATGPGPLLTARGAGREPERRADALEPLRPFAEERGAGRLLVLRDRVLEPLVVRLDPDVLELRDPGGEDVRVAMVRTLRPRHTRHRDHRSACRVRVVRPHPLGVDPSPSLPIVGRPT